VTRKIPLARDRRASSLAHVLGTSALLLLVPACVIDRSALSVADTGEGPPDAAELDAASRDAPGLDAPMPDAPMPDAFTRSDAFVPSDAGSDAGGPSVTFTRVQWQEAEGSNPTASFAAVPRAGNLLVAIGFHRNDAASMEIAGWDRQIDDYHSTGMGDRRGLAVFSRIATSSEPRSVQLVLDPARESRLLIQELEASVPGSFTFEEADSANSGNMEVDMLGTPPIDTPDGPLLVVGAFGSRDNPEGSGVAFSSLENAITLPGSRTLASAFAALPGGGPVMTTASWTRPRHATVGVLVFHFEPFEP
jgi:hypothetical protein